MLLKSTWFVFLNVISVIDYCDLLQLNSFLYGFLHWSSKRDPYSSIFPNLSRFVDQEIFVNSSDSELSSILSKAQVRLCLTDDQTRERERNDL